MSVQVASGQQLLRQMESAQVQVYRTGLFALDSLLGGGVRGEHVMELAGQAGTGKTQICLTAAADNLRAGMHVHWIDLLGAFRADRLMEILQCRAAASEMVSQELLSALFATHVDDPIQLLQALSDFEAHHTQPGILVIDGISAILQELKSGSSQHKQGQALLLRIARDIKAVARRTGCAVLITNSLDRQEKPIGGPAWSRQAHYTALLRRASSDGYDDKTNTTYTIQLETATFRPAESHSMLPFTIGKDGAYSHEPG